MNANAASFFVDRHVPGESAGRDAILHEGGRLTYGELAGEINRVGNYLKGLGVQPEQRVVLQVRDGPEWVCFFMAAVKLGAVAVPVNTFCTIRTLSFYLNDSRAPVLVTHREYADSVQRLPGSSAPFLRHIVYVEEQAWKAQASTLDPFNVSPEDSAFW